MVHRTSESVRNCEKGVSRRETPLVSKLQLFVDRLEPLETRTFLLGRLARLLALEAHPLGA